MFFAAYKRVRDAELGLLSTLGKHRRLDEVKRRCLERANPISSKREPSGARVFHLHTIPMNVDTLQTLLESTRQ